MELSTHRRTVRTRSAGLGKLLSTSGAPPWVARPITAMLGLDELQRVCDRIPRRVGQGGTFFEHALRELGVALHVSEEELGRVPRSGPTIAVANHPLGGLDGLVAGAAVTRLRSDMRILANSWLGTAIPDLQPWLIGVDVFAAGRENPSNVGALRAALKHLRGGGILVVFPAGVVSHWQADAARVEDPPWSRAVGALARRCNASVVPLYFPETNSVLFQLSGLVHGGLRTALLPRELLGRRGRPVRLRVGKALLPRQYSFLDDVALTAWMRVRTEALGDCAEGGLPCSASGHAAIPAETGAAELLSEWRNLDDSAVLATAGTYRVLRASGWQIPRTLDEIGRLREVSFRAVGEGTGACRDLDVFDLYYDHVFVVDRAARALVGAYRVGFCDRILRASGSRGLYMNSLFRLKRPMLTRLETALELGRSFVRPEYQRQALPLAMLWRGIGELLLREPRYDTLVGPASFSAWSGHRVLRLAVALLDHGYGGQELRRWVRARQPLKARLGAAEKDLVEGFRGSPRDLARMLAELDPTGRGLPVLIQRYLELGGKVLGFSVDSEFAGCLDAFVSVHVPSAPRAMLDRFMTVEGAASYLLWHAKSCHKGEASQHRAIESTVVGDGTTVYYRTRQVSHGSRDGYEGKGRTQRTDRAGVR